MDSGSAIPSTSRDSFYLLPVNVPPLPTQRAIVSILGSLDDKIELNRRMNETLEATAQAIYKSWFVDFDPVHAKAAGKKLVGMDEETAALFPDSFEDSALGKIPKGWRVENFSEQIEIIGGGTPKTDMEEYWNGTIPWFSVVDAPAERDVFVINTEKKITEKGIENSSTKILEKGTTIISARGTVGKLALVGRPMAMNQSCYGIKPIDPNQELYIYFALKNQILELKRRTHGSIFDTITRETFASLHQTFPPVKTATGFNRCVSKYLDQILSNLHETTFLLETRDTLLPRLLSGEIECKGYDN
jgi:type I restriction enzyme S subunit